MWDVNQHDSTFLLLAARRFFTTTAKTIHAMEALQGNEALVRSILLELAAKSMEDYGGICHNNLTVALVELELVVSGSQPKRPRSAVAEPALARDHVPHILAPDNYRRLVRSLLKAIAAGNFTLAQQHKDIVASVPAILYVARVI
jgi:hypothetical protein